MLAFQRCQEFSPSGPCQKLQKPWKGSLSFIYKSDFPLTRKTHSYSACKWEIYTNVCHRGECLAIILLLASEGVEELFGEGVYK